MNELDKELEARGLRFVRYVDDCNIYVNQEKSAIDRPWRWKFLGFSFSVGKEVKIRISKENKNRVKAKVRELTARLKSISMEQRIEKLNQYN